MYMIVRIHFIANFLVAKPKILHELLLLRSQFRTLLSMPLLDIKIICWKAHRNCSKSDLSACVQKSYYSDTFMLHLFEGLPESFPSMLKLLWDIWATETSIILNLHVLGLKDQTKGKIQERTFIIPFFKI